MKPPRFDFVRPETIADVHDVLAQDGDEARIIAGGQSLVPMLSMRLARPKVLVDIMRIPALATIAAGNDSIKIGAGVTQTALLAWPGLSARQPLLAAALPWIGYAQTRSRGTVCGSVAHADPSAEIPLVLLALGGTVKLSSLRGKRLVAAEEFFIGMMSTACADDEFIEAVEIPTARPGHGYAFREYGRRHGDFAIVACAAVAGSRALRFVVGGVADIPAVCDLPNTDGAALDDALDAVARKLDARDDLHATAGYRRRLVRELGRAAVEEARRCRA